MRSVTSKNASWPRLIWPTLYIALVAEQDYQGRQSNANKFRAWSALKVVTCDNVLTLLWAH